MTESEEYQSKSSPPQKAVQSSGGDQARPRYSITLEDLKNEVIIHTFRASGPGGQHRNVTDSGIRIVHKPSGVTVTATESRSQLRNKDKAFERLMTRLKKLNAVAKRRVPTKKSRAVRERELEKKKRIQKKKQMREMPKVDG